MNLPNKLTLFRVILIPVFLVFLLAPLPLDGQIARYIAVAIFCIASLTDFFDGYIARKYNLVTNFGKFMDPLADKLLVSSAMIALTSMTDAVVALPVWVVILIIAREFMITGFRTLAAEQNIVIAAGIWGKFKTTAQMLMIIVLLLNFNNAVMIAVGYVLIVLSVVLTIVSAVDYMVRNKSVLKN
jgi:CDP-diacylglycerol--glycerol-3-phosphate 3-phosphatidyltransferase